MDIDTIISEIKEKSQYRTRYAGQEPRWDETLVNEIERLRKLLAMEHARLLYLADCHAATAEWRGTKAATGKHERDRYVSICNTCIDLVTGKPAPEFYGREDDRDERIVIRLQHASSAIAKGNG